MIVNDLFFKKCENIENLQDARNYIRETLQIFIISALSDTDFYNNFAFTGGTCLRLMHNTSRYSEDLDFDCIKKDFKGFDFENSFLMIENYFKIFDIDCLIERKSKGIETSIITYNLSFNYKNLFNKFNLIEYSDKFQKDQKLKIKLEVQTEFNESEDFEVIDNNFPLYEINTVSKESMMANKLHAILRKDEYKEIKGRDYFDLMYYIENNIKLNIKLFDFWIKHDGFMLDGSKIEKDFPKNRDELIKVLKKKFKNIDFFIVKKDISSFVSSDYDLSNFNSEYFCKLVEKINVDYAELEEDNIQ